MAFLLFKPEVAGLTFVGDFTATFRPGTRPLCCGVVSCRLRFLILLPTDEPLLPGVFDDVRGNTGVPCGVLDDDLRNLELTGVFNDDFGNTVGLSQFAFLCGVFDNDSGNVIELLLSGVSRGVCGNTVCSHIDNRSSVTEELDGLSSSIIARMSTAGASFNLSLPGLGC